MINEETFANFEFILFALCSPTSTLPFNLKCGLKTFFLASISAIKQWKLSNITDTTRYNSYLLKNSTLKCPTVQKKNHDSSNLPLRPMFTYHFVSGVDFETAFNCEPTSAPTIDLFSLYVLFSQCRSCDNNLEDYFIQIHFIFPCMCPRVVNR